MEVNFAEVKPSLGNVFMVTFMAVLGITTLRWLFVRFNVPWLKELFASV